VETCTLRGVEPVPVEVQIDVSPGLPAFIIVGLADTAVLEARDRVRSALRASGYKLPTARLTVNLAPAPLRKHGTGFDLPIAVGILAATRQIHPQLLRGKTFVGELSLDGGVRPVTGLLAHAMGASQRELIVVGPPEIAECAAAMDCRCVSVQHLTALSAQPTIPPGHLPPSSLTSEADFGDVVGHHSAKRALEIAAAGKHNVLMMGPPGSGKSMLASRLPSILPLLEPSERRESALVHSVAGLDVTEVLAGSRPFRAPHHTATTAGLCGGGVPPSPGEVSLAHNGVLFLDEIPQLGPSTLQALRQPLEEKLIRLVRADGTYVFPAAFMLLAAANPCPCGYYGDSHHECRCTVGDIDRYQKRVGGPLLDRMDIRLRVDPERTDVMMRPAPGIDSPQMRTRVISAREFAKETHPPVSSISGPLLVKHARLTSQAVGAINGLGLGSGLSGRGLTRLIRVARTVADLELIGEVTTDHVDEAYSLRGRDGVMMGR